MDKLLAPGRALLARLTYPKRFALIGALFLPLVAIIGLLMMRLQADVAFAERERLGIQMILPAQKLLHAIQLQRAVAGAHASGDNSIDARMAANDGQIGHTVAALDAANTEVGDTLRASEHWQGIKKDLEQLAGSYRQLDASASFEAHTGLVDSIVALIGEVGDASNLILDPELDSYYLMDTGLYKAPTLAEHLAKTHAVGMSALVSQRFATDDRTQVRMWAGLVREDLAALQRGLDVAIKKNAALGSALNDRTAAATNAVETYLRTLDQLLAGEAADVSAAGVSSAGFDRDATAALQGVYALVAATLPALDDILRARVGNFKAHLYAMIAITVAALLLLVYVFYAFYRSFKTTVDGLMQFAGELAQGNLSASSMDATGVDELSTVARSFAETRRRLRDLVRQMISIAAPLATAAEEVTKITEETSTAIRQQQSETDQVATAMNEMASTAHEIALNASSAAEAAGSADKEAASTQAVVSQSIQVIESLAGEVANAADVIHRLESESSKIGLVLDVIKGVAEQTNLLALNAAIEAARAGEQGRGFAVVADEVRTLASRTQQSTQEINAMIARLQEGATSAVGVMAQSQKRAQAAVEQSARAREALNTITGAVTSINDMNHQIACAAEEQNTVVESINRNVISIRDIGMHSAEGAQQVASATGELSRLATTLQAEIARFKV